MKYTLVGVDTNAFSLIGYTQMAMKKEGMRDRTYEMFKRATSRDYYNVIRICEEYLDLCNQHAEETGWVEERDIMNNNENNTIR